MDKSQRELDRLMRQPPTPAAEARAVARVIERQRAEAQARLRAKRGVLVFSTKA